MVASFSEGSPSFILLATGILERSDASLSHTIHRRCCRTQTRTMHTQSLSPRNGIGPRHQLYASLSGLTSKGEKETRKRLGFLMQRQQSNINISPRRSQSQISQHSSETPGHPGPRLHNLLPSRVDVRTSSPHTSMIAIGSTK
jgi:hypothetical protein